MKNITSSLPFTDAGQIARLLQGMIDASTTFIAYCETVWEDSDDGGSRITDFRYRLANKMVYDFLNLPAEQVLEQPLSTSKPVIEANGLLDRFIDIRQTGQAETFEISCASKGKESQLLVTATPMLDGLIIALTDVTSHRDAEKQAQHTLQMLQRVLDASPYTFVYCEAEIDADGTITDFIYRLVNQAVSKSLNQPVNQIVGQRMTGLFPGIKEDALYERYVNVVKTGEPQTFEWYVQLARLNRWYLISAVPASNGFIAAIIDITELKELQKRLELTVEELKASNENLQHFAYTASHDLQEPLRKIQSFSSLMIDEYSEQLDANGQDILRRMQSAASRMQALIRDLLAYSSMATTQKPSQAVNLNDITKEVLSDLEVVIKEKNAHISVSQLPVLVGDARQLQQLFQNLLSNALKFNRPNQEPTVSIQSRAVSPEALPGLLNSTNKHYVAIEVKDNGIGFDPQHQDLIFQLFQRLNGQAKYQGTGIGLAICKRVAENHGGLIRADGFPDQGATFTVFLPAAE